MGVLGTVTATQMAIMVVTMAFLVEITMVVVDILHTVVAPTTVALLMPITMTMVWSILMATSKALEIYIVASEPRCQNP